MRKFTYEQIYQAEYMMCICIHSFNHKQRWWGCWKSVYKEFYVYKMFAWLHCIDVWSWAAQLEHQTCNFICWLKLRYIYPNSQVFFFFSFLCSLSILNLYMFCGDLWSEANDHKFCWPSFSSLSLVFIRFKFTPKGLRRKLFSRENVIQ